MTHTLKYIAIAVLHMCSSMVCGQNDSRETVAVGDHLFLPYVKGKVVNKVAKNDTHSQRVFTLLQSVPMVSAPQGYEVESHSDGNNRFLTIYFMPYVLEEGEITRKPGSYIQISFNDITAVFKQPLQSGIGNIYTSPVKTDSFMGYTIYTHDERETTVIYKGTKPLFLPVTQEEYLTALIQAEEKKQKERGAPVSIDDQLKEIDKAYQELLKSDKVAAAEFKKEMERVRKEFIQNSSFEDMATPYQKELARLSPANRKKQAYYAVHAMEQYGNYSGLVPEGEEGNANALVKPNAKAIQTDSHAIRLIVVRWNLTTPPHSEENSPRLYRRENRFGFSLTDDKMVELYENREVWKHIIECIK
ncbi:MAG: hypothetical protein ACK5JU_11255 [Bacteroidales bacterium]